MRKLTAVYFVNAFSAAGWFMVSLAALKMGNAPMTAVSVALVFVYAIAAGFAATSD